MNCADYGSSQEVSPLLYATDASVYEQVPSGVAFPRNIEDCISLIHQANDQKNSLICRGGGTSIAGQCVGGGIVLDFSRHMASILSSPQDGAIWVQPGVVLDDLNDFLRPLGWHFPIDISTSSRCTIGGMVGNNAAGSHSIVYGTTRENVLEVDAVLSDGSTVRFGPLEEHDLHNKRQEAGAEGEVYRTVFEVIDLHRDAIIAVYPAPSVIRRNTGYALDVLAQGQPWVADGAPFNLASLICGSEGTLALVTAIRLKLSPLVGGKALACIHFDSLDMAFHANARLLTQDGLAACELIDEHILRAAADHPSQRANRSWLIGSPTAVLVAEFFADTPVEAREKAEQAVADMQSEGWGTAWPVLDGADISKVWALRKAGLGLLMGLRQRARPVTVIEDSAVPVHYLPDFARDIDRMMHRFGIDCVYYGHVSVGLLHLRPNLDLNVDADRAIFRHIAEETASLVQRYRGSLSGEHGDGRLRAPYLREFLGEEVYAVLAQVKHAFDPSEIFNPGKILSDQPVDADLRRHPRAAGKTFSGGIDWWAGGGFDLVLERCNGSGTCRQDAGRGAMCPTFQATGDELYSTRGRSNLLRQAFSNPTPGSGLDDPVLAEAMESCLSCKACKSECPSGVDMSLMKVEYLYLRRLGRFWQPGSWLFGILQPKLLNLLSRLPAALRVMLGKAARTSLMMRLARIERQPPLLAPMALSKRMANQADDAAWESNLAGRRVLLLIDPFINHIEPEIGEAALSVLRSLGYVPQVCFMDCSLRFLVSEGYLEEAKDGLRRLREKLALRGDMPVIGLEPSELLLLRDEAVSLLGEAWPADLMARCFLLDEFLLHEHAANRLEKQLLAVDNRLIHVHPHCHERVAGSISSVESLLSNIFGLQVEIISTGCCGMGGSFGYRHRQMSTSIFHKNVHMPAESNGAVPILIASGTSCRQQLRDMTGSEPKHLAMYLADQLCGKN